MPPHPSPRRERAETGAACTSSPCLGLTIALLLSLAGCSRATAPSGLPEPPATALGAALDPDQGAGSATGPVSGGQTPIDPGGMGAVTDSAALSALPGRLIAIAAMAAGDRNQVVAINPASGAEEPLWTTPEGGNITDWSPAPDGRQVAYRMIQRSSPLEAIEAIVVRGLEAEAAPIIVAGLDTSTARLAGFVWAPDGQRIAYLKRTGALPGAGTPSSPGEALGAPAAGDAWELHVVEWAGQAPGSMPVVPDDRVIWESRITQAASDEVALVGWDPTRGQAVLAEVAGDSGITKTLLLVDTASGEEIERLDVNLPPASIAASPDGRLLALPEAEADLPRLPSSPRLRLLELATGRMEDLTAPTGDAVPGEVVWSPDAAWLAWSEYGAGGAASAVRVAPAAGDPPGFVVALEDAAATPLAFAPDASALLVGAAAEAGGPPERLAVVRVPGGERTDLPWPVPADAWGVSWVP